MSEEKPRPQAQQKPTAPKPANPWGVAPAGPDAHPGATQPEPNPQPIMPAPPAPDPAATVSTTTVVEGYNPDPAATVMTVRLQEAMQVQLPKPQRDTGQEK